MPENITPMMKQYYEAKKTCPDALLLFRMGDFYEVFHEDAKLAARIAGLALTSRGRGEGTPLAGFPHQHLQRYLSKLVGAGLQVAVCDPAEDSDFDEKQATFEIRRFSPESPDEPSSERVVIECGNAKSTQ